MYYYKRHIGDYYKKAGRLTMLQHGAYTQLIDSCYDREKFPTLDDAIEWTWASTSEEIQAVEFVLKRFFVLENGIYTNQRIQKELDNFKKNSETNRRIALEREAKRRESKTDCDGDSTNRAQDVNEAITNDSPDVHEAPPNQEPLTINQEPLTNSKDLLSQHFVDDSKPDKKSKYKYSDHDMALAVSIKDRVFILNPAAKKPNLEDWANTIRLMVEIDQRAHREIWSTFDWANRDQFWCSNILSPAKLRKQFDKLTVQINERNHTTSHANNSQYSTEPKAVRQIREAQARRDASRQNR